MLPDCNAAITRKSVLRHYANRPTKRLRVWLTAFGKREDAEADRRRRTGIAPSGFCAASRFDSRLICRRVRVGRHGDFSRIAWQKFEVNASLLSRGSAAFQRRDPYAGTFTIGR